MTDRAENSENRQTGPRERRAADRRPEHLFDRLYLAVAGYLASRSSVGVTVICLALALALAELLAHLFNLLPGYDLPALEVTVVTLLVVIAIGVPLAMLTAGALRRLGQSQRREAELKAEGDEANRAKTRFLNNMSHELRTPLNTVIGYSELLLEDAPSDGSSDQRIADLKSVHAAGLHLRALVNDVLDISKIEAGRLKLAAAPIELNRFVDDIVSSVEGLVESNADKLWVECDPDLGTMIGDATRLRQVIVGLLSNAAKFTRRGSIALMAMRERRPGDDWIRFAVSDTGVGLSNESLAKLFTDFLEADASSDTKYGGAGVALALTQRLCRVMGGEITAESMPGRGSCFTVRLPAVPPGTAASAPATAETAARVADPALAGDGAQRDQA